MTLALPMKRPVLTPGWSRNELTRRAKANPSLDLRFAENKSLVDATTGQNLVTFTRASSGTYVDSTGVIRTAVTNLLLQSEDFSTTWSRTNILAFGSGSTVNAIVAPNGTSTADLITEDTAASAVHRVNQASLTVAAGQNTASVYAKRANGVRNLEINANVLTGARAVFDLGSGTVGEVFSGSASIQSVGDGWYRCSVTGTSTGTTTSLFLQLNPGTTTATSNYTGDGTSGIYIWGAQLEQSTTVGEYVKTEATINSAPRFDHNPTTGESLGLLVEEQRTNLLTYSENFANAIWPASSTATITASAGVDDPQGTNNAATVQNVSGPILHRLITGTAGLSYTYSVWMRRRSGGGPIYLTVGDAINQQVTVTNNWTRVYATNIPTSSTVRAYVVIGSTGDSVDIWGAQLEVGSFPTSYIPTTTSAVTRSADVASISGSNFSGWYRQDEGTVFVGFRKNGNANFQQLANFDDATLSNTIALGFGSGVNPLRIDVSYLGSSVAQITGISNTTSLGEEFRAATALQRDNFAISGNGAAVATDTIGNLPSVAQVGIGSRLTGTSLTFSGTIRRLTYFPQRLPNNVLQEITR